MTFKDIKRQRAKRAQSTTLLKKVTPHHVVIAPLMTEKAYGQGGEGRKYHFKVQMAATSNDVSSAVEYLFGKRPQKVNTMIVSMKGRANRKLTRKPYKKAIVTMKKGESIDIAA